MQEWISQIFSAPEFGLMVLPAGFLLGLITAIGCLGCCAPIVAAFIGYSGSRKGEQRKDMAFIYSLGQVFSGKLIPRDVIIK